MREGLGVGEGLGVWLLRESWGNFRSPGGPEKSSEVLGVGRLWADCGPSLNGTAAIACGTAKLRTTSIVLRAAPGGRYSGGHPAMLDSARRRPMKLEITYCVA